MNSEPNSGWLHPADCDCTMCQIERFEAPGRIGFADFVWLTLLGIMVGHAIAFLIDPLGTIAIARDMWSFGR